MCDCQERQGLYQEKAKKDVEKIGHNVPVWQGTRLRVVHVDAERLVDPDVNTIYLLPGPGFGTGKHPTTCMCLNLLEHLPDRVLSRDVLDAGTGSGILAIAAARLGSRKVMGMEIDPEAVKCAKKNIYLNNVQDTITIRHDDLINAGGLYDLVLANLGPERAAEYGEHLVKHLKARGHLILSGLSGFEVSRALRRLRDRSGLRVWKRSWDQGWTALGLYKG